EFCFRLKDDQKGQWYYGKGDGCSKPVNWVPQEDMRLHEWVHVACVRKVGQYGRIYFNGVLRREDDWSRESEAVGTEAPVRLMGSPQWQRFHDGKLSEVRLWNRARSGDEIREGMCEGLTGEEPGLVGLWHGDESDEGVLVDAVGHHHGRLVMAADAGKERPRVGVCGWELSHNAAGRAYTLAQLYGGFAEVELIGCLFPKYGGQVWEPIRGGEIRCHTIRVEDEGRFIEQALGLVLAHPYEVVHLSKPRIANIILGLLYKLVWGARVIVDIDDEELIFVRASEPVDLRELLESGERLPKWKHLQGKEWTRIAVGLVREFDGVTVSNRALQERYGGVVIRHARDEARFVPSADLKRRSRERFGIAQDKKVVLFFGTPRKHKGLVTTARALGSLGRKDVVFAIIGDFEDGKLKEELQGIPGVDYVFVGNQPFESIPDVVAVGDICVLLQDADFRVSQFQIPAKLSDALGMGLVVLLSETAAVADVIESGAVVPVAEGDLPAVLDRVLSDEAECNKFRVRGRELLAAEFGFGVNGSRLAEVMDEVRSGVGVLSDELNLLLAGFPAVPYYFGGRGGGVLLLQQAQTAMDKGEWSEAAGCWRKLWKVYASSLSPEVLISISHNLFKLDAFTEAQACLKRVLASNPQHRKALEEQQKQYFYHTYSSWLMKTVEGIADWYKADGLATAPNWETAAQLYQPFIDGKQSYGSISQSVKTHLLLAEEYWERQEDENAIKSLKKAIAFFGNRLPESLINSIVTCVDVIRKNQVNSSDDLTSSNIKQEIHHTNTEVLSVKQWLLLYDVLSWNGLFESGFVARQKAIDKAYQQGDAQPNNITALIVAARAAIDQGDFTAANRFINRLAKTNCNSQQLSELRAYKYLQEGDIEGFRNSWPYPPRLADLHFQEYIRGKSVAVVGPAPTGILDGEEIDSFDVVIRFNYRGEGSIGDAREYGTKTNVSLYNAHTIRYFVTHNQLDILSNLDFSLIRRPRHDVDALGWDKSKIRLIYETDNIFYKSLNGAPAVLFDVLLQGADRVKLFKTNFYLTSQHHSEKYRGRDESDFAEFPLEKIQPVLANHDLVSQVGFTRSLWKAGLVDVDEQCSEIIKLSTRDYFSKIETVVGKLWFLYEQKIGLTSSEVSRPLMNMKQAIESAELAMSQNNWSEAINKLKFVLDIYYDQVPEKVYILMSRAFSAQGCYNDAELIIKKGIAKYPNEINLFVRLAQIAYDKKDWSEMIVCWDQILIKIDNVKNKKLVQNTKKQAYKNLAAAYGNLDKFVECAHFFEMFLQTSKIAHQLKPCEPSITSINGSQYIATREESIKLLALVDDDSSLFTLADAISDFEAHGCQVSVAQVVHKYGKRVSERQLSSTKIYGRKITDVHLSSLNEENKFLFEFDALLLCQHLDIFSESFYKLNTTQRPCLLALYRGVDFFPVLGICNRVFADIICLNNQWELKIYSNILPSAVDKKKRAFVYSPKYKIHGSVDMKMHDFCVKESTKEKNHKNVYFFAQSIVPLFPDQRFDVLNTLNQCAISNPNINLKIKLRHLPNENKTHTHVESLSYLELAEGMEMASNVYFSTETMDEVFDNADFCITCSSTAGIETILRGIPTLFYLDFIAAQADPLTKPALKIFEDSGLLCTKNDILRLHIKQPNIDWIQGFLPDIKIIEKIIKSIKDMRRGVFY
ncbi:glycosyl transferase group 1, partial [Limnospira maxima CS-328]